MWRSPKESSISGEEIVGAVRKKKKKTTKTKWEWKKPWVHANT